MRGIHDTGILGRARPSGQIAVLGCSEAAPLADRAKSAFSPMNGTVFSTYRIAALMDESMFELPDDVRPTTRQGDPWLRWANVGNYSGWYSVGERSPNFGERLSFWEAVLTLATEVGNGKLDAVHCVGPGILSVGGLGVTASSGYAQALLADCLEAKPLHYMRHMGIVIAESGAWLHELDDGEVCLETQHGLTTHIVQVEGAIRRGGGTSWSRSQKRVAKKWVEYTSRMLRDPKMDDVQVQFCAKHVPKLLAPVHSLIRWPNSGIRDGWMYTPEQQALWCVIMTTAIEDEDQTWNLVQQSIETQPVDARASLVNLYQKVQHAAYTETFVRRVRNSVVRVQDLFRIRVLG